ncbi:MAG: putative dehydrogenase [Gammaproteobacteria bacterium]|jgi:predicted dehydrogenase
MDLSARRDGKLAIGLVGMGRWGQTIYRVASQLPSLFIAAVASTNPNLATMVDSRCAVVGDWQALLDEFDLDGLVVATPPWHHMAPSLAALSAKVPVLIEKPLTMDVASAHLLLRHALTQGASAMVDHIHLHACGIKALRERLGRHGAIKQMWLRAGAWGPVRADVPVLWDWGAHDVAIALHLLDARASRIVAVDTVALSHVDVAPGGGRRESAVLKLVVTSACGREVPVTISVSNALAYKERRVDIDTDVGSLHYQEYPQAGVHETLDGVTSSEFIDGPGALEAVLEAFAQMIVGRTDGDSPDFTSLRLGCDVVGVLERAHEGLA